MDPARNLIHLGLKVTETTLDRAVEVVRLVDTMVVASADPDVREGSRQRQWPPEEEADLDAVSEALRAKGADADDRPTRTSATSTEPATTKTAARKSTPRKTTTTSAKKTPAKKSTAKKSTAKKAPATKSTAKKSTAKKSTARTAAARKTAAKASPRKAGE